MNLEEKAKYYRFGKPNIGETHSVFDGLDAVRDFLKILPQQNIVPIYEVSGRIMEKEDDVQGKFPHDGLRVRVEKYRRLTKDEIKKLYK
jgi:hypothetical protein